MDRSWKVEHRKFALASVANSLWTLENKTNEAQFCIKNQYYCGAIALTILIQSLRGLILIISFLFLYKTIFWLKSPREYLFVQLVKILIVIIKILKTNGTFTYNSKKNPHPSS